MPKTTHHIAERADGRPEELSREDLLQERGLLIRTVLDLRDEMMAIRKELSMLSSKQMSAGEWIELRDWVKITGEHYETAKKKCALGEYKTKPRDKKGEKYYIHTTELSRHRI